MRSRSGTATTTRSTRPAPTTAPLTRALLMDAAVSGATGVLLTAGAGALDELLGIPSAWLLGVGVFFLVFALDVALVATRPGLRRFAPVIVVGNALWVVASVIAVVAGAWDLTTLGVAFVLAQAGAVALLAVLQARGLRAA